MIIIRTLKKARLFLILFLLSGFHPVFSSPFIHIFRPSDYKADPQTYCSVQAPNGMMYFGNNRGGVLEFDGKNWTFIDTPQNGVVRSLAIGSDRQVYVGGTSDLGFLETDKNGKLSFHSLLSLLPDSAHSFNEIWKTISFDNRIYFLTAKALYVYDYSTITVIKPQKKVFSNLFTVENTLFLLEHEVGLLQVTGEIVKRISDHSVFMKEEIPFGYKTKTGRTIFISESKGLFEFKNNIPVFLDSPASAYLKKFKSYIQPVLLSNGNIAIPTIRGGVLIIDQEGNIVFVLSEKQGLPSNIVYSVTSDHENGLWVTGEQGISRVEYPSPWGYYSKNNGIKGIVLSILVTRDVLYAGTMFGLFTAELRGPNGSSANSETDLEFKQVPDLSGEVWHLEQTGNTILIASSDGLFQLVNGKLNKIVSANQSTLLVSKRFPGILFSGSPDGLFVYQMEKNKIRQIGRVNNSKIGIYSLNEDESGRIWSGSFYEGVNRFTFEKDNWLNPEVTHFDKADGLPPAENFTSEFRRKLVISTVSGLYQKPDDQSPFSLVPGFPNELIDASSIIRQRNDSTLWVTNSSQVFLVTFSKSGTYRYQAAPFNRLPLGGIWSIAESDPGVTWFGGDNGIFSYSSAIEKNISASFFTHIKEVKSDSGLVALADSTVSGWPVLPWSQRNLQFHFSSATFDGDGKTEFQYRLLGFSNQWSVWTSETVKEFTNLPAGEYQFQVRSKNVYGLISESASTGFIILPAWYSTWWARSVYLIVLLLSIFLFIQWRITKTQKEKILLEKLVFEKTSELATSYEQLKQSQTQLIQSEKMASLGTLVAGIAHEINNPVNFIQSSIYPLKEDVGELLKYLILYQRLETILTKDPDSEEADKILAEISKLKNSISPEELKTEIDQLFAGMESGASRTSDIVKSLRTFSRVDENDMKVFDLSEGFEITLKLLEKEIAGRIEIKTAFKHTSLITGFPGQINQVLMNVLMNAIQAIETTGIIEVNSSETEEFVILSVTDNGIGIPEGNISKLFDPFFTTKAVGKGTGLGLSISYQIIQRHRGKITVTSEPGKGSCFTIMLPKVPNLTEVADAPVA